MRHTAAPLAIAAAIALFPAIAKSDTATWIGGTGNWTDATKWDTGDVPGLTTNVVIDGDENVASVVTLASAEAVAVEALTIDEGDSLSIRKTNNGSQNFNFAYIDNAGALTMASHANGNAQTTTVKVNGDGSFWNKESGMITISGVAARNRTVINLVIPSGSRNDGKITLTQDSSDRNNSSIRIEKNGVLTNNGEINLRLKGTYNSGSTGVLLNFADSSANGGSLIDGIGTITLSHDEERDPTISGYCRITGGSDSQTVTNGLHHTLQGGGSIDKFALVNEGLVRATEDNWSLSISGPYTDLIGRALPLVNMASGRLVAISDAGLFLGANTTKPSQFINEGLLEARTGSFIEFRPGATHSTVKGANQIPAQFNLGGTFAGGGRIVPPRPVTLLEGSVIAPGDLSNTNGTGVSTAGTLTFTTNLTLSAGTTLDFQLGSRKSGLSDAVVVEGALTLAGTLRLSGLNGAIPSGLYRILSCAPGQLIGDETSLTVETVGGLSAPKLIVDPVGGTVDVFYPPLATIFFVQ